MHEVTLYTKPGCHLCESVEQVIAEVQSRIPFEFTSRNILDDPQDLERYQVLIPVVIVDGREIARYRLSAAQLEAALQAKSRGV
jgi:glutaredoxin